MQIPFFTAISARKDKFATIGGSESGEFRVDFFAEEKHNLAVLAAEDITGHLHRKRNHNRDLHMMLLEPRERVVRN